MLHEARVEGVYNSNMWTADHNFKAPSCPVTLVREFAECEAATNIMFGGII